MISPTGLGVRGDDAWGNGEFGASRGKRKHKGVDFICTPGQSIWFPFQFGFIERISRPYVQGKYLGAQLYGYDGGCTYVCKMFYFIPRTMLIIDAVSLQRGMVIGKAQDISEKYKDMTPHIHLQVRENLSEKWVNPKNILEVQNQH